MTTRRGGKPTRAQASAKALAALAAEGIDPAKVDPRAVLQSIAADPSAPASARVSAARALLRMADEAPEADADELTLKAIRMGQQ
jgi:hypothetical protein